MLPSLASHRGGTLTVVAQLSPHDLSGDPAVAWDTYLWQILSMTNDGLVGYRRVGGPAGGTRRARSCDRPAGAHRRRQDVHVPAPHRASGTPTAPWSGRRTSAARIERVFIINHGGGPASFFYSGLAGAPSCERIPQHCDLAQGIVANDQANTVTFHLTAPDPEFLDKLALPIRRRRPRRNA